MRMELLNLTSIRNGLLLILALLVGCGGSRINSANFGKINDGMSKAEVESILGPGKVQASSSASAPGFSGGGISVPGMSVSGENMVWQDGNRIITITFMNGKVMAKAQTGL